MSWSVAVPQQPFEQFVKAIEQAQLADDTYNKPALIEQWREQLEAAKAGAIAMLSRDGFGHGEAQWSATFTGSEFIHVTINRQP